MASFTLRQLELFCAIPDHPTLGAAAAALHMSESGLSHAITELERIVGEQLCVRRKARGVQLTPAGQFFATHARALLADADELVSRLAAERGELVGPLSIGCYEGISTTILPAVLDGFASAHPRVDVSVHTGHDDELLPMLNAGRLDVAITYDMSLTDEFRSRRIYDTEVLAVLPERHPLAGAEAVDLSELAADPFVLLDTTPSAANTRRVFDEHGMVPRTVLAVPNLELVRVLVSRGLGYSLLMWRPNYSMTTLEGGSVVMLPLSPRTGLSSVVGVWPKHATLGRRADALLTRLGRDLGSVRSEARQHGVE
ncbi:MULTISPECIES: LysR family transcriptional regulator [unclassified Rhodococcus (in: high G+C Gram-positive bacteria)]|uniref:LysR family transcriptional regulator n=1 Tax=unclassified Rhodococcus (in: high G+C Gram-positive bacteria) TaxID=192944 RepID=UPI0006FDBAF1|nr:MULTISPECIES: LysR substrate-binding domain-containing protein [unclassified Rhodococcus (in: high G+C Gram-positive bacteria)]KQU38456.1 LysR family transcriptional regulator [Rhodococcus sp. Leaf225]KQU39819.1 LysR family transcriptional regulator [Rhodococcus sp. Leaf258]